jgi:hypothetical protein
LDAASRLGQQLIQRLKIAVNVADRYRGHGDERILSGSLNRVVGHEYTVRDLLDTC